MADVFMKMSAEEGPAVNALLKILAAQGKVETGFKNIKGAAKEAEDATKKISAAAEAGGKAMIDNVVPGLLKFATLGGAAVGAVAAVDSILEKASQRAHEWADEIARTRGELAKIGAVSLMPGLEKSVKGLMNAQSKISGDDLMHQGSVLAGSLSAEGITLPQIERALAFGVKAAKSNQNPEIAEKLHGQLDTIFNGKGDIAGAAGKLMGRGGALDDPEMLELKGRAAKGQGLDEAVFELLAMRRSSTGPKTMESYRKEMSAEILPRDLEPKKEMSEESKKRMHELEIEKNQIAEQRAAFEREELEADIENGTSKSRKHHWERGRGKEIELAKKELALRGANIGVEEGRLKLDEVEVLSEDQKRKIRLSKIPIAERPEAGINDPSLSSGENTPKIQALLAGRRAEKATPTLDMVAKGARDTEGQMKDPIYRAAETILELENQRKNRDREKRTGKGMQDEAEAMEVQKNSSAMYGSEFMGDADYYAFRATRWIGRKTIAAGRGMGTPEQITENLAQKLADADPALTARLKAERAQRDAQRVIVEKDESRIQRIVPSRNGGD